MAASDGILKQWLSSAIDLCLPALASAPSRSLVVDRASSACIKFARVGDERLRDGKVAILMPAGGRSTRMCNRFRGDMSICSISNRTLFQLQGARIKFIAENRARLPWLVMTSAAVEQKTKASFERNEFFGIKPKDVHIFNQPSLPVMTRDALPDSARGPRIIHAPPPVPLDELLTHAGASGIDQIAPTGHGGFLDALRLNPHIIDALDAAGIEDLFCFIYPNVLERICDPIMLGFHHDSRHDLTTKAFPANDYEATENVGRIVEVGGQLRIVEYHLVKQRPLGELWHQVPGSTATHVISLDLIKRCIRDKVRLPFYVLEREKEGTVETRLEQFLFDVFPAAKSTGLVVVPRKDEYCPVKKESDIAVASAALKRVYETGSRTDEIYNLLAHRFDIVHGADLSMATEVDRFATEMRSSLRARVESHSGWRARLDVLDLGCGAGRDSRLLAERNLDVTGADLAGQVVAISRTKELGSVKIRRMDARSLPLPPLTFDGVWCNALIHHFGASTSQTILHECIRVLKPGGILYLTCEDGSCEFMDGGERFKRPITREEVSHLIESAGFVIQAIDRAGSTTSSVDDDGRLKKWHRVLARKPDDALKVPNGPVEEGCLLCWPSRFSENRRIGVNSASSIIWGDDDFVLFPDIVPIEEGHLLLTAVNHYQGFGAMPAHLVALAAAWRDRVRQLLRKAYGSEPVFVEHGPARPREAGVCIEHAHLHALPVGQGLIEVISERLETKGIPADFDILRKLYAAGASYIYVEEAEGEGRAFPVSKPVQCQFLRRVLRGVDRFMRWESEAPSKANRERFRTTLDQIIRVADDMGYGTRTA